MSTKRYYWIKLKTNFFSLSEIDFLLSQKNGCEYVVLYQMLCLNTANTNGNLESRIGEMIVPYDIDKIVRDTKHFDYDTVVVALELYKKLGLIYEDNNKCLTISNFDEMVGSETSSAKRVREWRKKQEELKMLQCNENVTVDVTQEYRDKSIENRDKILDIKDKNKENKKKERKNTYDDVLNELHNDDLKNALLEFIKFRKLIKSPLTNQALKLNINKLFKLSNDVSIMIEIINQSIENGWKGFYPLKGAQENKQYQDEGRAF